MIRDGEITAGRLEDPLRKWMLLRNEFVVADFTPAKRPGSMWRAGTEETDRRLTGDRTMGKR